VTNFTDYKKIGAAHWAEQDFSV